MDDGNGWRWSFAREFWELLRIVLVLGSNGLDVDQRIRLER